MPSLIEEAQKQGYTVTREGNFYKITNPVTGKSTITDAGTQYIGSSQLAHLGASPSTPARPSTPPTPASPASGGGAGSSSGGSNLNTAASWLSQNWPGGLQQYIQGQTQRYLQAVQTGDTDLISRLQADAQRVGYSLPNITNPHQAYIQQTFPGGLDAYVKSQQQRYEEAAKRGDTDLVERLRADAQRVGYQLPDVQVNRPPTVNELLAEIRRQLSPEAYQQYLQTALQQALAQLPQLPPPPPTLSWQEALTRARTQLEPQYQETLENVLQAVDEDAIRRGFFGQLPAAALRQLRAAQVEKMKNQAIADLANQLVGRSEQQALEQQRLAQQQWATQSELIMNALRNAAQEYQTRLSNVVTLINLVNAINQAEREKEFKEASLTGTYRGQPTLAARELEANIQAQALRNALTEAGITGYYQGRPTLEREQFEFNKAKFEKELGLEYSKLAAAQAKAAAGEKLTATEAKNLAKSILAQKVLDTIEKAWQQGQWAQAVEALPGIEANIIRPSLAWAMKYGLTEDDINEIRRQALKMVGLDSNAQNYLMKKHPDLYNTLRNLYGDLLSGL